MKDCILTKTKEVCITECIGDSGKDSKAKGKTMIKYEKEKMKESIKTCKDGGTDIKACLKTEFQSNSGNKKQVISSIKDYIKDFVESAVLLNESDADKVKTDILSELKTFCEDQMGLKRVNDKFLTKTVKDIACDKYVVALDS